MKWERTRTFLLQTVIEKKVFNYESGQAVSISHVDFIILLVKEFQIQKYYNEIFALLFLKNNRMCFKFLGLTDHELGY